MKVIAFTRCKREDVFAHGKPNTEFKLRVYSTVDDDNTVTTSRQSKVLPLLSYLTGKGTRDCVRGIED
jgi:hypothetical protein